MTVLGNLALWLTLLLTAWSVVVGVLGLRRGNRAHLESSRRAALVLPALLALAILSLITALLRRDFNVAFVASHSSRNLSPVFTLFALTASWNGALLLAAWVFSLLVLPLVSRRWGGESQATRVSVSGSAIVLLAVAGLLALGNPFSRLGITPLEGKGLDSASLDAAFLPVGPLAGVAVAMLGRALIDASAALGGASGPAPAAGRWLVGYCVVSQLAMAAGFWHSY